MKTPTNHALQTSTHLLARITGIALSGIALIGLLTGGAAFIPQTACAADPAPVEKKDAKPGRSLPFHGTLESVDKTARSIKIDDGRTFQVLPTTKLTKDGVKPGSLDDAKVGEAIGGAYREGAGGKSELVSLRLGPKPEKKKK